MSDPRVAAIRPQPRPTQLRSAIEQGRIDAVKTLGGGGKNEVDDKGYTPLMLAAMCKKLAIMAFLIESGAALNVRDDEYGFTAVHWAVYGGCSACTRALVDAGADLTKKNNKEDKVDPMTVLEYATALAEHTKNQTNRAIAAYLGEVPQLEVRFRAAKAALDAAHVTIAALRATPPPRPALSPLPQQQQSSTSTDELAVYKSAVAKKDKELEAAKVALAALRNDAAAKDTALAAKDAVIATNAATIATLVSATLAVGVASAGAGGGSRKRARGDDTEAGSHSGSLW